MVFAIPSLLITLVGTVQGPGLGLHGRGAGDQRSHRNLGGWPLSFSPPSTQLSVPEPLPRVPVSVREGQSWGGGHPVSPWLAGPGLACVAVFLPRF